MAPGSVRESTARDDAELSTPAAGDRARATSSFEDGDDSVAEKGGAAGLTKRNKVKRHCFRFKWWYLLGLVLFLAIILPILFKVIIPAIIKSIVKSQKFPVKGGRLNAISPTQLEMELHTTLDTPLGVKIDALSLKFRLPGSDHVGDEEFVTVQRPEISVNGETEVDFPNQHVDIADEEKLTTWFNAFFDKESTELRVNAPGLTIHLGSLKYTVDLDKTIPVPGLNYLLGFAGEEMEFMIPPEDNGDNIKGTLNIPNSGVMTLGLGTPSFFMKAGDVELGLVTLPELELKPGNNSAAFHGQFYFDKLIPNLTEILASQGTAISQGFIDLNCTGNATYVNGGTEHIRYLEGVLNNKAIPLRIPITSLVADVLGGVMGSNGDLGGEGGGLVDVLGDVMANKTMFEGLLDHFENRD